MSFSIPSIYREISGKTAFVFSLPLAAASYYTWKIDNLYNAHLLDAPGSSLFALHDLFYIAVLYIAFSLMMPYIFWAISDIRIPVKKGQPWLSFYEKTVLCILLWLPFLLAFFPAPGMNDTVYMIENPYGAVVQFPYAASLVYGLGCRLSITLTESREWWIFILSVMEMVITALCGSFLSFWAGKKSHNPMVDNILFLYIALFPMIGNYAIAAVRDTLYTLTLLLWMVFLYELRTRPFGRKDYAVFLSVLLAGLMLMRSNGLPAALPLALAAGYLSRHWKETAAVFCAIAMAAILPAHAILQHEGDEILFQESAAIPLSQMSRVLAVEGRLDEPAKEVMSDLMPLSDWKEGYSPFTVDFIKWNDHFRHNEMNARKWDFLNAWIITGKENPRIYMEAWMMETYSLWNLDPLEYNVQSRFGWALSDENTEHMEPKNNDMMAAGDFPMPAKLKAALANYQFELSRFLGPGFSLWLILMAGCIMIVSQEKEKLWVILPVAVNWMTLMISTPASGVFRYSFIMVLGLPMVWILALSKGKPAEK